MTRSELKIKWRKKLQKYNKSYYVNIPQEVAQALANNEFELYVEDGKIILEPIV